MKEVQFTGVLILLFFTLLANAQNDSIDWRTDLLYIKNELPKKHSDLFFKISETEFSSQMDRLIESVPNLNVYEMLDNLNKIIAQIGDSHTSINFGNLNKVEEILPIGTTRI